MSKYGDRTELPLVPQRYLFCLIMLFGIAINFSARHLPGGVEKRMVCWAVGAVVFALLGRYARKKGDWSSLVGSYLLVLVYFLAILVTAAPFS